MIYRFRVILDTEEDVFRDIEIEHDATLEDFHNVITQSFAFDGTEMASFYISDDQWSQGEEISLFDMSDGSQPIQLMNETMLSDVVHKDSLRLIYVYDFLSMWTFMVELADIAEHENGQEYPNIMFVHGQIPDQAPDKEFKTEDLDVDDDDDDDDDFLDLNEYQNLGFDKNWN